LKHSPEQHSYADTTFSIVCSCQRHRIIRVKSMCMCVIFIRFSKAAIPIYIYIYLQKRITNIYIYIYRTSKELHGLKCKRKTERDTAVEKTNAWEIINIIPKSTAALQKPTPPAPRVPTSTPHRRPRRVAEFYIPISCSAIQRRSELKSIYIYIVICIYTWCAGRRIYLI